MYMVCLPLLHFTESHKWRQQHIQHITIKSKYSTTSMLPSSERLSFTHEIPTHPNSTKIGTWVAVTDVINHTKFGNDRSREYKVTEGRILACSIGMACRL